MQLSFTYPNTPGWKRTDTSLQAAEAIAPKAETLRNACYRMLSLRAMSADEVAELLEESVLAIRPRITELFKLGKICDTGKRTMNKSGRNAIVWRVKL